MPSTTLVSEDGLWWWDGQHWQPIHKLDIASVDVEQPKPPLFPSQPTWLTIALLIFVPPLGLVLLWTQAWPLWLKMLLTMGSGLLFMGFVASRLT